MAKEAESSGGKFESIMSLMPAIVRARFESRRAQCAENLRQTGQALFEYALRRPDRRFPPVASSDPWSAPTQHFPSTETLAFTVFRLGSRSLHPQSKLAKTLHHKSLQATRWRQQLTATISAFHLGLVPMEATIDSYYLCLPTRACPDGGNN
jgi:hypothetical protein